MMNKFIQKLPLHAWLGLLLVITIWALNWSLTGLRTHWLFFLQWLGYCLIIDGLVFLRRRTSMLTRNPLAFAALFLISIPGWWLFELINARTQNWFYLGAEYFTSLQYFLLASVSFSTVMPAVFGTAELASTFGFIQRMKKALPIALTRATLVFFFLLGCLMLLLLLAWPHYFFPFVWLSIFFIIEPLNVVLKHENLAQYTAEGDWRPVISLWIGCLICALFWEMWNFYSYPKWIYQVPFVDYFHIFEMPVLGYGGYMPFALELFAVFNFIVGAFKLPGMRGFVQIPLCEQPLDDRP
jgi:hypothetical protein